MQGMGCEVQRSYRPSPAPVSPGEIPLKQWVCPKTRISCTSCNPEALTTGSLLPFSASGPSKLTGLDSNPVLSDLV